MYPDVTKLHTKVILVINGPIKQFPTKEGTRERFDIEFTDGYKAEYCPLIGVNIEIPKSGQEFTFKIRHRGPKGDEIEAAHVETQAPTQTGQPDGKIVNMNGHPAVTALNGAIKIAEINKDILQREKTALASDILEDADMLYEWLIMKANNC